MKPRIPPQLSTHTHTHTHTRKYVTCLQLALCVWSNTGTHKTILWQTNMKNLLDNTGLTDEGNPQ